MNDFKRKPKITGMRLIIPLLISAMLVSVAACAAPGKSEGQELTGEAEGGALRQVIDTDREGNSITLPDKIERVISIGPSNTEILAALGFADMIIATDEYSVNIEGLRPGIPKFSMMQPDGEQLINLIPDLIFVTGMSKADSEDPFKVVSDAGICLIYIPSSDSIEAIKEDIRYIGAVLGAGDRAGEMVAAMDKEIDAIKAIGETITDKKKVYIDLEAGGGPRLYSLGSGVFLNEMIELVGAENVFAEQERWISIADEAVLSADPDVILTTVDYIENPIEEIKSRPGWNAVSAVRNDDVYYITADYSSRPNHNIVKALWEIARAVYPELYS